MISIERRKHILELVDKESSVSVSKLSALLDVSEATIRRDLRILSSEGLLRRVHGGAISTEKRKYEHSCALRSHANVKQKTAIGLAAANLVNEGDSIAIDVGTTTLEIARAIVKVPNITVVTASLPIAMVLSESPFARTILTGGIVRTQELSLIGHVADAAIRQFRFDKAFIAVGGLHIATGLTDYSLEDSLVKRALIMQAEQIIVVADSSKLERTCFAHICSITSMDVLVTDVAASPSFLTALKDFGIRIVVAEG